LRGSREATMNSLQREHQPIESMSGILIPWLDFTEGNLTQLTRWLQGYDLPAMGSDEPYILLLYGLPVGEDRYVREIQLAERVAHLLNTEPDVNQLGKRPQQLLYNLLFLCAGLSCPDQLAEPLYRMYKRRRLHGQWLNGSLHNALLSALIGNQIDNRLHDVWEGMLEGQSHEFLPGNVYDGFEGILWMPESKETRGEPSLKAIGYALKVIAWHLDEHPKRRPEFTSLLDKVQDVYIGHSTWEIDLLYLANENQWPKWAVECLPSLSIILEEAEPHRDSLDDKKQQHYTRLAVWWPFNKVLEAGVRYANYWYEPEKSKPLCNGNVFEVIIPQHITPFIIELASRVEPSRIDNPYPSPASVVGNIADAMSLYELELIGKNPVQAEILGSAHKVILEEGEILFTGKR
jgi:hypothetical protein